MLVEPFVKIMDDVDASLTNYNKGCVEELLCKYADAFSKSKFYLGHCNLGLHKINSSSTVPFRQPRRRHQITVKPLIDQQVKEMLAVKINDHQQVLGLVM